MCKSCEALRINGVYCHETGCPDSHLNSKGEPYAVECKWCGTSFIPEEKGMKFCSNSCCCAYNGLPCEDDEEDEDIPTCEYGDCLTVPMR
jgi:hypothetical protein